MKSGLRLVTEKTLPALSDPQAYPTWKATENSTLLAESQRTRRAGSTQKSALDIGTYLRRRCGNPRSAILTSATLAQDPRSTSEAMLSLDGAKELILGSPVQYKKQARLCIPRDSKGQDVEQRAIRRLHRRKVVSRLYDRGGMFVLSQQKVNGKRGG